MQGLLAAVTMLLGTLRSAEALHDVEDGIKRMDHGPESMEFVLSTLQERDGSGLAYIEDGPDGSGGNSTNFNETVTIVTTPVELMMAINQSDPYIEIRNHMDLTGFPAPERDTHILGTIPPGVLSIQGNCHETVPWSVNLTGASMLPLKRRQCAILTDAPLMKVSHGELWLDNVYIRRQSSERGRWGALIQELEGRWFPWQDTVKLWMTKITMQGDGDGEQECSVCAIDQSRGQLYAEDCAFSDFKGSQVAAFGSGQTSASLVDCTFANNMVVPNKFFDGNHAVIEGRKHLLSDGVTAAYVLVRLEGTDITNCTAAHDLLATGGTRIAKEVFYSDHEMEVFMPELRANTTTTRSLTEAPKDDFLGSDDYFIVELKKTLSGLARVAFKKRDPQDHRRRPGSLDPYPLSDRTILSLVIIYCALGVAMLWACCSFVPRFFPRQCCHCPVRRSSGSTRVRDSPRQSQYSPLLRHTPAVPSTSQGHAHTNEQTAWRSSNTQQRQPATSTTSAGARPSRPSAHGTVSPKDDRVHVRRSAAQSSNVPNHAVAPKVNNATLTRTDTPTPESPKREPKQGGARATPSPAAPPNPTTLPPFIASSGPSAQNRQPAPTSSRGSQGRPNDIRGSVPPTSTAMPSASSSNLKPASARRQNPNSGPERKNSLQAGRPHTAASMPQGSHLQYAGSVQSGRSPPPLHSQTSPLSQRPTGPRQPGDVPPTTGRTSSPSGSGDATRLSSHAAHPGSQRAPGSGRSHTISPQDGGQQSVHQPARAYQYAYGDTPRQPSPGQQESPVRHSSPRPGYQTATSPPAGQAYASSQQHHSQYQRSDKSQAHTRMPRPDEVRPQPRDTLQRSSVPQARHPSRLQQAGGRHGGVTAMEARHGNVTVIEDPDEDYTEDSSSSEEYDARAQRRGACTSKRSFLGMKLPKISLAAVPGLAAARQTIRRAASTSPQRRSNTREDRSPDPGANRNGTHQYEEDDRRTRSRPSRQSNQYSPAPSNTMYESNSPELVKPLTPSLQPPVFPNVRLQAGDNLMSHHHGTSAYDARYPTQHSYDQQDRRPRSRSPYS